MSYIPDCRVDEYYNEKYLNKTDTEYIRGFDYVAERADNFFNNLDVYISEMDIPGEDINLCRLLENHEEIAEKFKSCILDWLERERDMTITSMIDNMDDDEYDKIRADVDSKVE